MRSTPATIFFDRSTIDFVANGIAYSLPVPAGQVTFSSVSTATSTSYDAATGTWFTTVSPANFDKNVFVSGLAFRAPSDGLPGSIGPVTWQGRFQSDTPGLTVNWQWGAAVYAGFFAEYNDNGVKPVDGDKENPYHNGDHVGVPENVKGFLTAGATGGGGSNWTGSWSSTGSVTPCAGPGPRLSDSTSTRGVGLGLTTGASWL